MFNLSVITRKKIKTMTIFLLLIFIMLTTISPAFGENVDSIFTPYTKVTLENGLTVIVKETHFAPVVAVDIRVGVGSANESPDQRGISHFIEHMFFKGTERRKTGEIAREIKAVGGHLNATTSQDTTHYYVVAPSEYTDLVLDVTADAIQHTSFDPEEIDRERNVIIEEMRMRQDNPQILLFELIHLQLLAGSPYANNIIGTPETLSNNIDRKALVAYYQKFYLPNNMVLAVAGDVDTQKILTQIEELFKDFEPREIPSLPPIEMKQPQESARFEIQHDITQTCLYFGFPVPPANSEDAAALEILRAILDGGRNARLSKLYTEGIINTVAAEYWSYPGIGIFGIYVSTQNPSLVEQRIQEILEEVITKGVSDDEVAVAKAILRTGYAMEAEKAFSMACMMSAYEVMSCLEDGIRYEQALQEVTKEDVQRVAEKYVNPQRTTLLILEPKEVK